MAKDPAMLLYTKDFLTGTALLGMRERGQYITLLCLQQQLGHMSMAQMRKAAGRLSPALLGKFVQDEEGLYYNERAEEEIRKREAFSRKQRENVMMRWGKNPQEKPVDEHGDRGGITAVIPSADENENENGNAAGREGERAEERSGTSVSGKGEDAEREGAFAAFWAAYPRKTGRQAARRAFDRLPAGVWPLLVPAVEAQKRERQWQEDEGRYIPNPATWLEQGRWEDEGTQAPKPPEAGRREDLNALLDRLEKYGLRG